MPAQIKTQPILSKTMAGFAALIALTLIALMLSTDQAKAEKYIYQSTWGGVAIDGYDTVAYFTDKRPVEGDKKFSHDWKGATWYFVSAANRDAFAKMPEAYAPQYGGYCAWAAAQGEGQFASTDAESWKVVDGKLYLNYSQDVQRRWESDIPGLIKTADKNWPRMEATQE